VRDDRRDRVILFCLALLMHSLIAWSLTDPPYVDAHYYTVGARRIAEGYGFTEPFLWHYLDVPATLPRPGFLYWMPLPSILAAPLVALPFSVADRSFLAVQFPFILLSSLLPLVGYAAAWQVAGLRRHAWAAALLTLFSGFFLPFWTLPETFAPFALFGSLALWLAGRWGVEGGRSKALAAGYWLLIGLLVGLAHLTRADGVLLLLVVALALLLPFPSRLTSHASRLTSHVSRLTSHVSRLTPHVLPLTLGYLLVMAPWFIRNLSIVGTPLSPAGAKTIWLTTYDDLACYGCDLSLRSYLAWGWGNILSSKLSALWINFQRFLAEDCQVFLLPFVLIGLYRLRKRLLFTLAIIYLLLLYLLHSLVFTFPGWRGSFFHASGVLLPFLYAAAMEGLDVAVEWMARRRRGWNLRQAQTVFTTATVVAAVALSGYATVGKLSAWRDADVAYREIGAWLGVNDVPADVTVVVGNPPGFYYHTGIPAVVVPNGDVRMLLAVADRYGAAYIVLDHNRPTGLAELYASTKATGLELVATFDGGRVQLYRRTGVH